MIDYSFMSGLAGAQPSQPGAQPQQTGPLSQIPNNAVTTQNSEGIADALMSGATDPVAQGNKNAQGYMNKLGGKSGASYILASIGQALSAKDPSSWQHQLSTSTKAGAQSQMVQRGQLVAALQQKIGAPSPAGKPSLLQNTKAKYNLQTPDLSILPAASLQLKEVL